MNSDAKKGNLKRRSSVARSIRRSQSTTGPHGFTFEQQLIASTLANASSTTEEKLQKIIALSLSATVKTLQQENEQLEVGANLDIDDVRADLIDHHVKHSGRKPLLEEKHIDKLTKRITAFKKTSAAKKSTMIPHKDSVILSSRLRTLKQYEDSLNGEINAWDELLQQRKTNANFSRLECQMVLKGEKKITNSHRSKLPRLEEAWLRGLSDGRAELNRLKKQELMMKLCEKSLHKKMFRKRKSLEDKNIELEQTAKTIYKTASQQLLDSDSGIGDMASSSSLGACDASTSKISTDSEFAKEVHNWVQEMQSV